MTKAKTIGTILAIDTSCDDTAIAVATAKFSIFNSSAPSSLPRGFQFSNNIEILSSIVSSQVKLHAKYGGVYPSLAKREHQNNLAITLKKALEQSGLARLNFQFSIFNFQSNPKFKILKKILQRDELLLKNTEKFLLKYQKPKVDAIAVTVGPGLEPCLWQGVNFAKVLAFWWDLPIIPVNHIEGHLLANLLPQGGKNYELRITNYEKNHNSKFIIHNSFPIMGLVVSGGHTELILIKKIGQYQVVGQTLDDAAGECFDKTARILGLAYPGGPSIAAEAAKAKNTSPPPLSSPSRRGRIKEGVCLPRPMFNSPNFNFSFSGLKTAVLYHHKNQPVKIKKSASYIQAMAREIQQAIIDVLLKKTFKAARLYNAKTIILGGGVAANEELRQQFANSSLQSEMDFLVPAKNLCTDNAAMVAVTGFYNKQQATNWNKITVNANWKIGNTAPSLRATGRSEAIPNFVSA